MQVVSEVRAPWALAIVGVVIAALSRPDAAHGRVQAAVTPDGFVVTEATSDGIRVAELGRDGRARGGWTFKRQGDVRVVGTGGDILAVYEEQGRIRLTSVEDGSDGGMFGKHVRMLCDGVASNDHRFAVGWLESDDTFWFVHGPVATATAVDVAQVGKKAWCGIASAGDKIALLWRDRDRMLWTTCSTKKCGMPGSAKLPARELILGFGCLRNVCLIARRPPTGSPSLSLVAESGAIQWTKPLDFNGAHVSIVGVGDSAFAVGVGTEVYRVDRKGGRERVWSTRDDRGPLQLAWSRGTLLIADPDRTATIELPR